MNEIMSVILDDIANKGYSYTRKHNVCKIYNDTYTAIYVAVVIFRQDDMLLDMKVSMKKVLVT